MTKPLAASPSEESPFVLPDDPRPANARRHPDAPPPEPYEPSPALVRAVNLSIFLRRPLLLEGEAGCGKTRLARAVAHGLGVPLFPWYVRSTSKAQEGLYTYDAILRLHDVHVGDSKDPPPRGGAHAKRKRNPQNPEDYRTFGAIGEAFRMTECPAVVLIDEIDKADLDFPNDLLTVLDEPWEFEIRETEEKVAAKANCKPIVLITSNKEKGNLPAPFLRRCIYFYLDFPEDPKRLHDIVATHYELRKTEAPADALVDAAVDRFLKLRQKGDLHKKPSTSEFLDWIESLKNFGDPKQNLTQLKKADALPFPETLFKLRADLLRYTKAS